METTEKVGHIYLLQEREFIVLKQPVYKIGKTHQKNSRRFSNYPKNSNIVYMVSSNNFTLDIFYNLSVFIRVIYFYFGKTCQ